MADLSQPTSPVPDSPNSLRTFTTTIDKLTNTLSNYTRSTSPEPPHVTTCCCGRDECENTRAWLAYKAKLEGRLILSAEIGQALLEKHEAYVRQHEPTEVPNDSPLLTLQSPELKRTEEQIDARIADLLRENAVLEKRMSQALVSCEITETAHQTTLNELKHAEERIARLTAHNARLLGAQARLDRALQERDDIQQERDSAAHQARVAETRSTALSERCSKLQAQLDHLRDDTESHRSQRRGVSEEVLSDARTRLRELQQATGEIFSFSDGEVMKVLESLVAANEALNHDNKELQTLLDSAQDELRTAQEELDERRADDGQYPDDSFPRSPFHHSFRTPTSSTFNFGTAPAKSVMHTMFARTEAASSSKRRSISAERGFQRGAEPLTPETNRTSLSPTGLGARQASGRSAASYLSMELESHVHEEDPSPEKPRPPNSFLTMTRSRAVQTDRIWSGSLAPSLLPLTTADPSHDGHSDTSSDPSSSVVGVIVERTAHLLNRLVQADALTLMNRLKRQRLLGADVSHLSRTTVSGILNESNALRAQFRAFLEDDKVVTTCTRRDLRALFKVFRDMFAELGQLRVTLNDVILDPSVATKVSEMALHPSKTGAGDTEASPGPTSATPAWMAQISKVFGLPTSHPPTPDDAASKALSPPARPVSRGVRAPQRIAPKREAALSASTVAVSVEFSGTGVGRAVASTSTDPAPSTMPVASSSNQLSTISSDSSRSVMDIFAGAPRPISMTDPWVVVPKPQRGRRFDLAGGATIGRSALRHATMVSESDTRFSRTVDALDTPTSPVTHIAEPASAIPPTLLERTLRSRGLSDSSIHTTFLEHAQEGPATTSDAHAHAEESMSGEPSTKPSMLQAFTRRVQNLRFATSSIPSPISADPTSPPLVGASTTAVETTSASASLTTPAPIRMKTIPDRTSQGPGFFPALGVSWAASAMPPDDVLPDTEDGHRSPPGVPPSYFRPRDEQGRSGAWARGREF